MQLIQQDQVSLQQPLTQRMAQCESTHFFVELGLAVWLLDESVDGSDIIQALDPAYIGNREKRMQIFTLDTRIRCIDKDLIFEQIVMVVDKELESARGNGEDDNFGAC